MGDIPEPGMPVGASQMVRCPACEEMTPIRGEVRVASPHPPPVLEIEWVTVRVLCLHCRNKWTISQREMAPILSQLVRPPYANGRITCDLRFRFS